MKKILLVFIVFFLSGCQSSDIRLPDLEGKNAAEIDAIFATLDLEYQLVERTFVKADESNVFIEYGMFLKVGEVVAPGTFIPVIVTATLIDTTQYYVPENMPYDGPYLEASFFDLPWVITEGETLRGGGGAFYVDLDLNGCIDGDTARFMVPDAMIQYTHNAVARTRFFNFDSPETFRGGEEEFGLTASKYACDLLEGTGQIVLQTDPGDNLFDRFGRLLAWIWIENDAGQFELLNYWVVRQGLGEVAYLFGAGETDVTMYQDFTYTEWMFIAEEKAREDGLGLFGSRKDFYWDYDFNRPLPGARP